ncbi:DUF6221 family protein [Streptomyces bacillaris]|uniref:DUF6221 family protein n=1 Tax=Streptomyces bacillaris TaxID=68179 RepID=UPI003EBE62DB
MDLHTWITRQVDRVEVLAKAATPGPWEGVVDHHQRGVVEASVWADKLGYYITEKVSSGERHEADAHHVGHHHPDAVLRRCEADRRILARHNVAANLADSPKFATACDGCRYEWLEGEPKPFVDNLNDCPELLDLAHAHGITPDVLAGLSRPSGSQATP